MAFTAEEIDYLDSQAETKRAATGTGAEGEPRRSGATASTGRSRKPRARARPAHADA